MAVHGIDLGTTNSAIAHTGPDGRPEVLAGPPTTPSVVVFAGPDEHVVGEGRGGRPASIRSTSAPW